MIIKVEISEETWARMLTGKRVEGSIGLDLWSKKKDFFAHHRKPRSRKRDRMIKKLPWGWVKESDERIKTFSSVPKELGIERLLDTLDEEHMAAEEALMDAYIVDVV